MAYSTISIFGKRRGRKWRIASSSGTKQPREPIGRKRGSSSGTLTRAKRSSAVSGSRTKTPRLSDRPEMYGNGWPGPTASGVSTGKTSLVKSRSSCASSSCVELVDVRDDDAGLGERRPQLALPEPRLACGQLEHALADLGQRLERRAAVRRRDGEPGVACSVRPATRTMKNSSRFDEKNLHMRTRSSSATSGSSASSSTRPS